MKKKSLLLAVFSFAIMLLAAISVPAETYGDFTYSVENGQAVITGLTDPANVKEAVVPSEINGIPVKTIEVSAFAKNGVLEKISIPSSVNRIGSGAFFRCEKLESVVIPEDVTVIELSAFARCTSLRSVQFSSKTTEIKGQAFYCCTSLESVAFPDTIKIIGEGAFRKCDGLTEVAIPSSVETVGIGAFENCANLTSFTLRGDGTIIEGGTLYNTPWFADQPDGLVYLGKNLYGYKGVCPAKVELEPEIICIAGTAFAGADTLEEIVIPSSVRFIGYRAFMNCSGLKTVTVPESVITLGTYAFEMCTGLESITVKSEKTAIGECAIEKTKNLTIIGKRNSPAKEYAEQYGINFEEILIKLVYGDANGDEKITSSDIVRLKKYFAAFDPDSNVSSVDLYDGADANGDGKISSTDIVRLKKFFSAFDPDTDSSPVVLGPVPKS